MLEFHPKGIPSLIRGNLPLTLLIIAAAVLLPTLASGWADVGHTTINRVAAENVPADMPQFLKTASSRIGWLGPEPDRWCSDLEKPLNAAQAPDHFIDLEYVDWLKPLPPDRYKFIQAVYEYRAQHPRASVPQPEKIGFQPYITIEVFDRLKVAFREYRHFRAEGRSTADAEANAIFYAGWLGHYVGDGSNPMHTSIQYNGWVKFIVNKETMPAGQYSIKSLGDSAGRTLFISSSDQSEKTTVIANGVEDRAASKQTKLVFLRYGDRYFLSQIWVEGNSSGHQLPKSPREAEVAMDYSPQPVVVMASLK